MSPGARIGTPVRSRLGAVLWVIGPVVFFAAQVVVGSAWTRPAYSWSWNNVSDLGHVRCEMWAEDGHGPSPVCSPLHPWMNVAFVVSGACLVAGCLLLGSLWRRSPGGRLARVFLALSGAGLAVSGLVPADVAKHVHQGLGALPIAVFGALGLLLTARELAGRPAGLAAVAAVLGVLGVVGFVLFLTQHYAGLGPGGMERVWGYGSVVWTLVAGARQLAGRSARRPVGPPAPVAAG